MVTWAQLAFSYQFISELGISLLCRIFNMSQSFATQFFKLRSCILLICDTALNQVEVYSGKSTIGGFHR